MSFDQQHIVITGAASGIGKALLNELAFFNCRVLVVDKDESGLNQLLKEFSETPMQLDVLELDLANLELVQQLVPKALEKMGQIDLFFANAGFAFYGQFKEQNFASRQAQIMVNMVAPLEGLHQMLHISNGKQFSYVITASAMAKTGMPNYAMYAATKAALDRFADCFRFEENANCHLMLVYPIATRTAFFKVQHQAPLPWPSQSAKTVAKSILKSVVRKKQSVYPSFLFQCMVSLHLLNQWLMYPYQYWNRKRKNQK
jgi:short-subunit dehydrogenase